MENLQNVLRQIHSPYSFAPALKQLSQITMPKLNKEIVLLLRNVVRINNKDIQQFDGLVIVVKIVQQTVNYDYTQEEWLTIGENFSWLIIAIFDSILLYQNSSYIKDATFCNLILKAGKSLLPIVDKTDCLRVLVNNNGYSSMLQMICLDELDFLVRKEIFLLFKPIIVKSDTRQRKTIMNSNELFLSKLAAFILKCGDYETQEAIVEVLMRFSYSSKQKLNKLLFWFRNFPNVLIATKLLDYKNFDITCRKFLNSVNATINTDEKVLTLPCFEAYANDILLQKPVSEQYEELWVDFSLKTGIIHIVCDSGINAWLRLFIESKNVKKSLFSSRFIQKNDIEVKGKQILLELKSPLEINFKENLIVTITLTFVESPKLEYLQEIFFDKWYQHLNKAKTSNQYEAVSKAFRESVNQRSSYRDKFFPRGCNSSISSIPSCSTSSEKHGICNKGHRSPAPNCNKFQFSTSTPKDICKWHQDSPSANYTPAKGCISAGNLWSNTTTFVNLQSTPSISGGIFRYSNRFHGMQKAETKSSLVKGISISDNKEEDGLFQKMIEESITKGKNKQLSNWPQTEPNKHLNVSKNNSFIDEQAQSTALSSFGNIDCSQKNNAWKLGTSKNDEAYTNGIGGDIFPNEENPCNRNNQKDYSEKSTLTLTSCSNKQIIVPNESHQPIETENSSLSQVCTSDEASTKSTHKKINLLNTNKCDNKKLSSQKITGKPVTSDINIIETDFNEIKGTLLKDSLISTSKKPNIHSPYLKLFRLNNSMSSVQSDCAVNDEVTENQSKIDGIKKQIDNSTFKLKPSVLNINTSNYNLPTLTEQNSFSFLSKEINTFPETNEYTKNMHDNKLKINAEIPAPIIKKIDETNSKKINKLSITKRNGKKKPFDRHKNAKETADISIKSKDEVYENDVDKTTSRNRIETNAHKQIEMENNSLNDTDANLKQTVEDLSIFLSRDNNNEGSNDLSTYDIIESNGHLAQHRSVDVPNTSCNFEKKLNNTGNIDTLVKEKNSEVDKLKTFPKNRNSMGSTGTQNTTISSLQSYHCIAIPEKTYSTRPINTKPPHTPDKIFDNLKRQTANITTGNKKSHKSPWSNNKKRKLFTPNSSLEETSPYKPGEDSVRPPEILVKENPSFRTNKRKSKQNLNSSGKKLRKDQSLNTPKLPIDVYNFSDSNQSVSKEIETNGKEKDKGETQIRRSLRIRSSKRYREISTDESEDPEPETVTINQKSITKKKTHLVLPSEKLSVTEKVSQFVLSINKCREDDIIRDEDLESELQLSEVPVEENKSDVSQLEAIEPPVWLSTGGLDVPSPPRSVASDLDATLPTELKLVDRSKDASDEIDFLKTLIKNVECLSLSIKRKPPKINSQEKFEKTVEAFTNSSIEEMNEKWKETRNSLQLMISNMDSLSESCRAFMTSFEKRMKDMIGSSVSEFNMDRGNSNERSQNICKVLKKMCQDRHKLLKNE